jgi:hypothetical protein
MLALDGLDPPALPGPPTATEQILEAVGGDAIERDVHRKAAHLSAIAGAAVAALQLEPGSRLACVQPLTAAAFGDPVLLGWISSGAQLLLASGPGLDAALGLAADAGPVVAVDTGPNLASLLRALGLSHRSIDLRWVLPGPELAAPPVALCKRRLGHAPRELWQLEELGILGFRAAGADAPLVAARGVEIVRGDGEAAGAELLVRTGQAGCLRPDTGPREAGSDAGEGLLHTGFRARFEADGTARPLPRREDGLVRIEGRRVALRCVAEAMCRHRRIRAATPRVELDPTGEPVIAVSYDATGESKVEDLEEHTVAELPPYMVPRRFEREGRT